MPSNLPQILQMAQELRIRILATERARRQQELSFDEQERFALLMRRLHRHAWPFIADGGGH
jgi:hypothetical protein